MKKVQRYPSVSSFPVMKLRQRHNDQPHLCLSTDREEKGKRREEERRGEEEKRKR
jgi:hypothetical protein